MARWLSSLGFSSDNVSTYASIFYREAITEQALHLLTVTDLEGVGIEKLGHRVVIHNSLKEGQCKCKNQS